MTKRSKLNGTKRVNGNGAKGISTSGSILLGQPATKNGSVDIELFAGAGGMTLGLAEAGLPPDHLFEIDKHCCATLRHNASGSSPKITGQIHDEDVAGVDWSGIKRPVRLLSGGPPCQPFSFAGKHLADRDGRNQFPAALRAVRELRPQAVLLENVPGLTRQTFKPYFDYILRQLECPSLKPRRDELWDDHDARIQRRQASRGYQPEYHVASWLLNAADFGVAQARLRVFFVAIRSDIGAPVPPVPTHSREALIKYQESGAYWRDRGLGVFTRDEWPRRVNGPSGWHSGEHEPWRAARDALKELPEPLSEEDPNDNHWLIEGARLYRRHSGSEMDWPAKTIKAGVHGVAGGENVLLLDDGTYRYFTLREMARLQSFPDEYHFTGPRSRIIGQIGNAVPCALARVLGQQILGVLDAAAQETGECTGRAKLRQRSATREAIAT